MFSWCGLFVHGGYFRGGGGEGVGGLLVFLGCAPPLICVVDTGCDFFGHQVDVHGDAWSATNLE